MSSKTRNRYNDDFKAQTLALVDTGKPISEVAEELGVSSDLVYRWRRERERQVGSAGTRAVGERPGADDLPALLRENARLRVENDILKKAAIILGTKSPQNAAK